MKAGLTVLLFTICFSLKAQQLKTLPFGKNTLTGKVVLKTLIHPVTEKPIRNAMVLKLPYRAKFTASNELEEDVITDEIRIYGDVTKNTDPNKKYKELINQNVTITANIVYAPSGNYPLLVNIIENFNFKVIK